MRAGRVAGLRCGAGEGRVWGVGVADGGTAVLVFAFAGVRGVGVALGAGVGVTGTGHR